MKLFKRNKNNNNTQNNSETTIQKESYIQRYSSTIKSLIREQANKPQEERSRDFKALILTLIIIPIIVFIFWKVPFLHKFIFP